MAPELIKGDKHNNKVDIWALGCIIFELLTLNVCFESKSLYGIIDKIVKRPHGKIDTIKYSHKWQNIIDLLLKKDYKKRPDINEVYKLINKLGDEIFINEKDGDKKEILGIVVSNNKKSIGKRIRLLGNEENRDLNKKNIHYINMTSKTK